MERKGRGSKKTNDQNMTQPQAKSAKGVNDL